MKKNRLFEDAWKQCNEEVKMAKMQLKNIQANIRELLDNIETCDELDVWVQSYLTKADDYLDSVKKYVVFGKDEDTTIIEPTLVSGDTTPLATEPIMPPIDKYDPDVEKTSAMDLTPDTPEEAEEEPVKAEFPEEIEGEDEFPEEDEEEIEGEDEFPEEDEEEIKEPEELDLDDEEFKMPSMRDFEVKGGKTISEVPMPKPKEEDQLSLEDIDFFNNQEYSGEEEMI